MCVRCISGWCSKVNHLRGSRDGTDWPRCYCRWRGCRLCRENTPGTLCPPSLGHAIEGGGELGRRRGERERGGKKEFVHQA